MERIANELDLLDALVPLAQARIVEIGCGGAHLARALLQRHPGAAVVGLEVDERQHAKNLAQPAERLQFVAAGAQAIPFEDASFDGAMMLKSLHHVPLSLGAQALDEARRVLRPGGWLYVSEPVYGGAFNDIVKLFNDEGLVRAAAQGALDDALARGGWREQAERRFATPVRYADFDDFERRMMHPTFAERHVDDALRERVRAALAPHWSDAKAGAGGATFERLMHVRLLRREP